MLHSHIIHVSSSRTLRGDPPNPRQELSKEVARTEQAVLFELDELTCWRKARRCGAPGASGMTSDNIFPVLEREADSQLLAHVGSSLAVRDVPDEIIDAIRSGRITALSKPDGNVCAIVVCDIVKRMVARTTAKQVAKKLEAMSTKGVCECCTMCCNPSQTQKPPSCPLIAWVHTTSSPKTQCLGGHPRNPPRRTRRAVSSVDAQAFRPEKSTNLWWKLKNG